MQGSELAKHLREKGYRDLIIIGITADIYALDSRHQYFASGMNGVLIKPLSLMSLESELLRYFQAEELTTSKTSKIPKTYREEYSFDAFENLLRESPEYILVILDEIKKVHDEVLLILNNESIDEATFRSMVHKVKGGAQLLSAKQFTQACEALEQEGILEEQVASFRRLLEEQNHTIESHQSQFQKSFNDLAK
jgi:two-component system sensor histidine kinase EvgS